MLRNLDRDPVTNLGLVDMLNDEMSHPEGRTLFTVKQRFELCLKMAEAMLTLCTDPDRIEKQEYPACIGLHGLIIRKKNDEISDVIFGSLTYPVASINLNDLYISSTDRNPINKTPVQLLGFLFKKIFWNAYKETVMCYLKTDGSDQNLIRECFIPNKDLSEKQVDELILHKNYESVAWDKKEKELNYGLYKKYPLDELTDDYDSLWYQTIFELDADIARNFNAFLDKMIDGDPKNRPSLKEVVAMVKGVIVNIQIEMEIAETESQLQEVAEKIRTIEAVSTIEKKLKLSDEKHSVSMHGLFAQDNNPSRPKLANDPYISETAALFSIANEDDNRTICTIS